MTSNSNLSHHLLKPHRLKLSCTLSCRMTLTRRLEKYVSEFRSIDKISKDHNVASTRVYDTRNPMKACPAPQRKDAYRGIVKCAV